MASDNETLRHYEELIRAKQQERKDLDHGRAQAAKELAEIVVEAQAAGAMVRQVTFWADLSQQRLNSMIHQHLTEEEVREIQGRITGDQ